MLSAVVHRRQRQQLAPPDAPSLDPADSAAPASPLLPLHVADLMACSGIRSLRYLLQAGADHGGLKLGCAALAVCLPGRSRPCSPGLRLVYQAGPHMRAPLAFPWPPLQCSATKATRQTRTAWRQTWRRRQSRERQGPDRAQTAGPRLAAAGSGGCVARPATAKQKLCRCASWLTRMQSGDHVHGNFSCPTPPLAAPRWCRPLPWRSQPTPPHRCRCRLPRSLLARCRLEGRFFDLIDSDSFGHAAHFVGASLDAVRYGGLVCLTSTSGAPCCPPCPSCPAGRAAAEQHARGLLPGVCPVHSRLRRSAWQALAPLLHPQRHCSTGPRCELAAEALLCPPSAGTIAGGRDAASALALYGLHLAPVPHANEQASALLCWLGKWCSGRSSGRRSLVCIPTWAIGSSAGVALGDIPMPVGLNLQGLRMRIGLAHREAMARRLR